MSFHLRRRLSFMMLLEYAIWGAWAPVLSAYLGDPKPTGLGFSTAEVGVVYSLLPLASIITPFIAGQIADRRFATQRLLGVLQLLCAGGLFVMAKQHSYSGMSLWMFGYSLIFAPTLALTNSLAFHHLGEASDKEFGRIRVWGTIGWIISGLVLSAVRSKMPHLAPAGMSDCLLLASVMAAVMGVFSFTLPHTPPQKDNVNPLAFLEAVKLLKDRNFAVFMVISFIVATELQFYYMLTAPFLENAIKVPHNSVSAVMTLAQAAELIMLGFVLPPLLPKIGVRKAMVIGIIAWPVRYIIFAAGAFIPALKPLVIASLTLHGFCYVFFFVVGFIYVDQVAHKDIRASAQSLIALVVLGAGAYVGSLFTGWIGVVFTNPLTHAIDYGRLFLVPCALTVLCALIFPLLFRDTPTPKPDAIDEEPLPAV